MTHRGSSGNDLADSFVGTEKRRSLFEQAVRTLPISVCSTFFDKDGKIAPATFRETETVLENADQGRITAAFPRTVAKNRFVVLEGVPSLSGVSISGRRVGVLFSGGPAPGGHNVLAGLKAVLGKGNTLLGIRGGPKGLLNGRVVEVTSRDVRDILNTGGFNFLGTDRTKIKSPQQFEQVRETVLQNRMDGLVIVGGDDSNTNAAFIAEYFETTGVKCNVVGIPKTIDGDLAVGNLLPIPFGFDTATKIYSELVGNLTQDAASAVKYWHFVKLMGRTASKITLEVALQTKPAVALISEEIAEKNISLENIVDSIVQVITERRLRGLNYGVVLVPEGLIEFIPEMRDLIRELNAVLAEYEKDIRDLPTLRNKLEYIYPLLTPQSAQLMASLPDEIEEMLILDRDDHGNVKVSQIETEKLLIEKIRYKISEIKRHTDRYFGEGEGKFAATPEQIESIRRITFAAQSHFLGYEGRSAKPTTFDASFAFALGMTAGSLVLADKTGYMAAVTDFHKGGRVLAIPLPGLITVEMRKGKEEFVIEKSLVKLSSPSFQVYAANRDKWAREDYFSSPGPIQHWGPTSKQIPISVALDQDYPEFADFDLGKECRLDPDEI
ncbi:MAG TPA: diphosphate--fructose-6-phosphate 1-phosphotransferase [Syntrophobacteraceae bacterium]|nr:diphosphate--fructose-6-phosphate 1-phosphotransferase [Syntrophobacteraceae bacterium]